MLLLTDATISAEWDRITFAVYFVDFVDHFIVADSLFVRTWAIVVAYARPSYDIDQNGRCVGIFRSLCITLFHTRIGGR